VQSAEKALLAISASNYPLKFQAQATRMATALKTADAQLEAATWPVKAQADVKAVIAADVPLIGDLGNVSAALDLLESDASIADTAAHNLQVTLGG
jgi:hypothetical protein